MIRFKTGRKSEVIRRAMTFAIRDQHALIDAYTPAIGKPDRHAQAVIDECKKNCEDFLLIFQTTKVKR